MRAAVEVVAEMQITAEQLRAGLRTLPPGYGAVYDAGAKAAEAEAGARSVASRFRDQLADRWMAEVPVLPFDRCVQRAACGLLASALARTPLPTCVLPPRSSPPLLPLQRGAGAGGTRPAQQPLQPAADATAPRGCGSQQ